MRPRLALSRVARLSPRSLHRYLCPLLRVESPSVEHDAHLRAILIQIADDDRRPMPVRIAAADARSVLDLAQAAENTLPPTGMEQTILRRLRILEEALATGAGVEPLARVDWPEASDAGDSGVVGIAAGSVALPVVIWVPHIRSPFNLGNIIRTAAAYGVRGVVVGDAAPALDHPRVIRAAMGAERMVRILRGGLEDLPGVEREPIVALETGGIPIDSFTFPEKGVLVVGHEELGVPEETLERASRRDQVVTIPHGGTKSSLNVGVATGIALSWWVAATNESIRG